MRRKAIAQDTLKILKAGFYESPSGVQVNLNSELASCLSETKCYNPDSLDRIKQEIFSTDLKFSQTEFEVRNETSLSGAERMAKSQEFQKIGVLNFASAKNPGGGFLNGAQAQEESLARSSALYSSLLKCPEHYEFHRSHKSLLYSDRVIYSPTCPVFKTDNGTLLESAYFVDFITSPAPNAGQVRRNYPQEVEKIPEVLRERGAKVLSLAAYNNCDALVLGAWGCGVFRNDSAMVAQMFADYLLPGGQFWRRFKKVLFSVLDSSKEQNTFTEFDRRFLLD
ncbi:TIGR02452 family protein [Lusitaniella coriacea LEGE 07157]|uniref:TIGR02452 family protein n=1 Tax=Lusitaniella coriacea LEGE 07157 TaxID=945747 RepID=A0A8J7E0G2_9CYAN|nr:TIGR02452 family protein [Lusitaniella coriacea]MBE9119047.1 TIGR02452 family protein [Lusitaniella coriacea LEGE 07157]